MNAALAAVAAAIVLGAVAAMLHTAGLDLSTLTDALSGRP